MCMYNQILQYLGRIYYTYIIVFQVLNLQPDEYSVLKYFVRCSLKGTLCMSQQCQWHRSAVWRRARFPLPITPEDFEAIFEKWEKLFDEKKPDVENFVSVSL
jgi:hypothetical protein